DLENIILLGVPAAACGSCGMGIM
ncbi:YgiT-type zinc finger protein, partial [Robinsoniella peoriensis]